MDALLCVPRRFTVYWEIFEVQNFQGLVFLKFLANKFLRMAFKVRSGHVHDLNFQGCWKNPLSESECFLTHIALDTVT